MWQQCCTSQVDLLCFLMQACFAGTHSVFTGCLFWGVNGIGLSLVSWQRDAPHALSPVHQSPHCVTLYKDPHCSSLQVIPNGQSLIADYNDQLDRGKAFGWLYLTGAVGAMLGTLYATNIGAQLAAGISVH
jgi:hypothetical protein